MEEVTDLVETCWRDIEARGFVVAAVEGDRSECDWAYTIGLHRSAGHPELVLVGLAASLAGGVLETVGQRVLDGHPLRPGAALGLGPLQLEVRRVGVPWLAGGDWFELGRKVLASRGLDWPPTLQVLWPDRTGEFPRVPGDPRWTARQPLLAER